MAYGDDAEPILSHEATSSRHAQESDSDSDLDADDNDEAGAKLLPGARDRQLAHHAPHEEESNWKIVRDIVLEASRTARDQAFSS